MERSRKREYIIWDTENNGGTNLEEWGLYLSDFSETPPEPKTTIVEIPYGDNIDITESLTGDVQYSRRSQTWTLTLLGNTLTEKPDRASVQKAYTKLLNNVHGKTKNFKLSWDEGATYTGRATVEENEQLDAGNVAQYTVSLDCEPWRDLGDYSITFKGIGSIASTFESPRRATTFTALNESDVDILACFDLRSEEGMTDGTAHQYSIMAGGNEKKSYSLQHGTHTLIVLPATGTEMRMYTDIISDFDIATTLENKDILKTRAQQIIWADIKDIPLKITLTIPQKEL